MVWIKIDEILPWIELEGNYKTKKEAEIAARENLNETPIKIVRIPEERK